MRFLLTFLTICIQLTVMWLQLPQAEAKKRGVCCLATMVCYSIRTDRQCHWFPNGYRVHYQDPTFCYSELCGSLRLPTPCCGVRSCNIFCCNCDKCWKYNNLVAIDFRNKYYGKAFNVFERATIPKLPGHVYPPNRPKF